MQRYSFNEKRKSVDEQKRLKQQVISQRTSRNQQVTLGKNSRFTDHEIQKMKVLEKQSSRAKKIQPGKQDGKSKRLSQGKLLIYVLKRVINGKYLANVFELIKNRIKVDKIALVLLSQKHKRHLNDAFLVIRQHYIRQKSTKIILKLQQLKSASLLCVISSRIFRRILNQSFQKIKTKSVSTHKVCQFVQKLQVIIHNSIPNTSKRVFFQKIKLNQVFFDLKGKYLHKISLITNKTFKRILNSAFTKTINFTVMKGYEQAMNQRKYKNRNIISVSSSRKSMAMEEKEEVKKLKLLYESQNLQKNRSLNELKKSKTNLKHNMSIDIRQLQKQEAQLRQIFNETQQILSSDKIKLQIQEKRKSNASKGEYCSKVTKLYKAIQFQSQQHIKIPQIIALNQLVSEHQMNQFSETSAEYYLSQNHQLLELIRIYEGRRKQAEHQQPFEYMERKTENGSLKNMLSLLIKRQINQSITGVQSSYLQKAFKKQSSTFKDINDRSSLAFGSLNTESQQLQKLHKNEIPKDEFSRDELRRDELPISSKKSSNNSSVARMTGKITSRAIYSNL